MFYFLKPAVPIQAQLHVPQYVCGVFSERFRVRKFSVAKYINRNETFTIHKHRKIVILLQSELPAVSITRPMYNYTGTWVFKCTPTKSIANEFRSSEDNSSETMDSLQEAKIYKAKKMCSFRMRAFCCQPARIIVRGSCATCAKFDIRYFFVLQKKVFGLEVIVSYETFTCQLEKFYLEEASESLTRATKTFVSEIQPFHCITYLRTTNSESWQIEP